jgi:hypothetical protein
MYVKKRVFICSPLQASPILFTTVEQNIKRAEGFCKVACEMGVAPFAPHAFYTRFLDEANSEGRECGIACGIAYLRVCEELWVCGNVVSAGMQQEINIANSLGITVKWYELKQDKIILEEQPRPI